MNVVGQYASDARGAAREGARARHGLSETASGDLVSFAADGTPEFTIRGFDDARARRPWPIRTSGCTFALDLPHVSNPAEALTDMVAIAPAAWPRSWAASWSTTSAARFTDSGIASIRRTLERASWPTWQAHGVPAGGPLARRLCLIIGGQTRN